MKETLEQDYPLPRMRMEQSFADDVQLNLDNIISAAREGRTQPVSLPSIDKGSPFAELRLDLAAAAPWAALGGDGHIIGKSGHGLVYRRQGSNPQGRLTIEIGGDVTELYPGMQLMGRFDAFRVRRASSSGTSGQARLVILERPDVTYQEPQDAVGLPFDPVDLLGVSSTNTYIDVAEDTQPSGASPVGSFTFTGFSKLRVLVNTLSDGDNATTFDLIPWFQPANNANWFEQGLARISIPDTDVTKYQYRVFTIDVSGSGKMYFEIRNLLEAARITLGFIVQGIR